MAKRRTPTAEELRVEEEEDFIKRFEVELIKLANEGIAFTLPEVVVGESNGAYGREPDHVSVNKVSRRSGDRNEL